MVHLRKIQRLTGGNYRIILLFIAFSCIFTLVSFISHRAYSESGMLSSSCGLGTSNQSLNVLLYEDFENYSIGELPSNWTVIAPGYGLKAIWVQQNFQRDNQFLTMSSFSNKRAIIAHNLSVASSDPVITFRVKITEKQPFNESSDTIAFTIGFETEDMQRIRLLELGRSDNQTILPFNVWYAQGAWIPFEARVDLESSTSSVYVWGNFVGNRSISPINPSEIRSLYLLLGGGKWYVGQFDDILVEEYVVPEKVYWMILSLLIGVYVFYKHPQ